LAPTSDLIYLSLYDIYIWARRWVPMVIPFTSSSHICNMNLCIKCVYINIYEHVDMYIRICWDEDANAILKQTRIYIYIYIYICIHMLRCGRPWVSNRDNVCICIYIYMCIMHTCIIYTYIYIYIYAYDAYSMFIYSSRIHILSVIGIQIWAHLRTLFLFVSPTVDANVNSIWEYTGNM